MRHLPGKHYVRQVRLRKGGALRARFYVGAGSSDPLKGQQPAAEAAHLANFFAGLKAHASTEGPCASTTRSAHDTAQAGLRETPDARKPVESGVEAQDTFDPLLLHDGEMESIARRHMGAPEDNFLGALHCRYVHGEHLIDNSEQGIKRRLNGIPAIDSGVSVQDFLENFGIGDEAFAVADQPFKEALRVGLVRMVRADQVHRDIGIDEDHGFVSPAYPLSISARISWMSPEGKS